MLEQERAYYQNLIDAGFTEQATTEMLALLRSGKRGELFRRLAQHRDELLCKLHVDQRHLDCLDFFLYQIKKN